MTASELLRPDLRELASYPGGSAAAVRYRPGAEVRQQLEETARAERDLAEDDRSAGRDEVLLRRRERLVAAISAAAGVDAAEIVPFASLATLFSVVFAGFARSRDRQPASVMLAAPARSLYKWSARVAGLKTVEVPLDAQLRTDLAMMARALGTLRPSVIVVGVPHDGTGMAPEPTALETLLSAAAAEALVVLDESFAPPDESRRVWRTVAPHLAVVRSFEPWLGAAAPDLASSWLELAPDLARSLAVFPPVARPELSAKSVAAGEALLTGAAREPFVRETHELLEVHERLRARLGSVRGVQTLPGRAPFVGLVHDEPADQLLAEAARRGLPGVSGGGVGRLARLTRIAVADDAEATRVAELVEACSSGSAASSDSSEPRS